ncbi:MAG: 1-acyl-sn-glycerol-3-phosphate acyltransferase [Lachnospiraceae bacterium]|nr:1-acyl-sn-glycerol-3-phosphate acyltransferase [Candidatus Colinaster scatohippi]
MLRIIIAGIFVFIFLVLTIPVLLVEWIVGEFNPKAKEKSCFHIIQWAFRLVLKVCGTKVIIYGEENIPTDRSVLFVGNHRSIFDILLVYTTVKRPTGIIAKQELKKVPLLNVWMANIGCFFLDRKNIKEGLKMVLNAVEKVKDGMSILIFPEGTRSKEEGVVLPFKGGSFKIAEKSGCDVIPFAIINSAEIFENHKPFIKKTKVIINYGEPIHTSDFDRKEYKEIPDIARNKVIELHDSKKNEI